MPKILDPLKFFLFFLKALGIPHILVKSFLKIRQKLKFWWFFKYFNLFEFLLKWENECQKKDLTTLDPLKKKFFFLNALGFLNIHVKSFWKSGKNWNFGDFLTFIDFNPMYRHPHQVLVGVSEILWTETAELHVLGNSKARV